VEQEGEKGSEGESESDAVLIDEETGLEVGMVERESEDLGIVFVKIRLFLVGLVPLLQFGGGFGGEGLVAVDAGATDGGSEAIGLGLRIGVDIGLESVKEKEGDFEEGEGEGEDKGERCVEQWVLVQQHQLQHPCSLLPLSSSPTLRCCIWPSIFRTRSSLLSYFIIILCFYIFYS